MAFMILLNGVPPHGWVKRLKAIDPQLDLRIFPDVGRPEDIEFALVWSPLPGELKRFANLRCIASMGAGVDHILRDPELPDLPVTRVVDPSMAQAMSEYIVMAVLNHCRYAATYFRQQREQGWKIHIPRLAGRTKVGIMGLGQLGTHAANRLAALGFKVAGWRRSPGAVEGIETFCGQDGLDPFLGETDVLVCLLPLTTETRDILNARLFGLLRPGAFVINVARGDHLVEADLVAAIDGGHLSGACLDVFRTEPLPAGHPFWDHPAIIVTPHTASITNPSVVAAQIYENYRRVLAGQAPLHRIDRRRGY